MLQVLICENNSKYQKFLEKTVLDFLGDEGMEGSVYCSNGKVGDIEQSFSKGGTNLVFLDVELNKEYNGLELAKRMNQIDCMAYIVFVSGHLEYVFQSFKVRAFDFIPKPVTKEIIHRLLRRVIEDINVREKIYKNGLRNEADFFRVKCSGEIKLVRKREIVYAEKAHNKVMLFCAQNTISCYNSLENIEKELGAGFIRVHKGFIVNKRSIKNIELKTSEIIMEHGYICNIGGKYKKTLLETIGVK